MNRTHISSIEPLEARIAPANLSLIDVDGDFVTIHTSKSTDLQLKTAVTLGAANALGGQTINKIDLTTNLLFDGTDLSVTATPGPLGGDGLVNVGTIVATMFDLGTVTIDGGLTSSFTAGKGTAASKVKAINARSISGTAVWTLEASVGTLHVTSDLVAEEIHINGTGGLGTLFIGGSLIGTSSTRTGYLTVPNGKIGSITIGGDVIGGTGSDSGEIIAKSMGAVTIKGSIRGSATDPGGGHTRSGVIESQGTLGAVKIGGDLRGGALGQSGIISSAGVTASITVGGSVIGGPQASGSITINAAVTGNVSVGHDVVGGGSQGSGYVYVSGKVSAMSVGGSIIGGTVKGTGYISAGAASTITVKGDVIGGTATSTGEINVGMDVGTITVGGSLLSGSATDTGQISVGGTAGTIAIAHNVLGSAGSKAAIEALGHTPSAGKPSTAIKNLTIGGRVENALIVGGSNNGVFSNPDAQIGAVKVNGDWIASNLICGVTNYGMNTTHPDADDDINFGDIQDHVLEQAGEPDGFFSKIASIIIGGRVEGSPVAGLHFGFVAQEIGAFKVNGVAIKLTAGHSNDTSVTDTHHIIGASGNVVVHEV